jgi:hypothetical protein
MHVKHMLAASLLVSECVLTDVGSCTDYESSSFVFYRIMPQGPVVSCRPLLCVFDSGDFVPRYGTCCWTTAAAMHVRMVLYTHCGCLAAFPAWLFI